MSNHLTVEIEFRLNRLSVRLEQLATHFALLGAIVQSGEDSARGLIVLQDCKLFIEWTGIDLDVDRAYALLQIQRQLVQWQRNWDELWRSDLERLSIDRQLQPWAVNVREMLLVLV